MHSVENYYKKLIEESLTGIYIDQDGRIVFANQKFADIYGYTREEIVGMDSRQLVHPEDSELTDERREKRLQGQTAPAEYEARGLKRNGDVIWLRRRNTRIEYHGKAAILGNIVDITEMKNREAELKQFLYAVSHDLQNPIVAIQGFSERLRKKYGEDLGEKGLSYLNHITASADKMERLVKDLLTLSRLGRVELDFGDVPASKVFEEVISNLDRQIEDNKATIRLESDLPVVRADRTKLYQVFQNLLSNAIKYSSTTPNPEIVVGHEKDTSQHRFYVKDNGIGIDAKNQEKIFQMLTRADGSQFGEGTGLGLSIVQKILEKHGGEIWVDSEKGKGATFYFTLPT